MVYASDVRAAELEASDMPTDKLFWLALSQPVAEFGNELYGRSHCWYSLGHTQAVAWTWLQGLRAEDPAGAATRKHAARALGLGGWDVANLASAHLPECTAEQGAEWQARYSDGYRTGRGEAPSGNSRIPLIYVPPELPFENGAQYVARWVSFAWEIGYTQGWIFERRKRNGG
jgi:hypothetical protein